MPGVLRAKVGGEWVDILAATTAGAAINYVHTQGAVASTWVIPHNLGWFPNITVIDSSGATVEGDIVHNSAVQVTLTFSGAFSGVAYLS